MCPHFGLQDFMKAMNILAGDHRQRFFGFRSFSLDVYYIDSSPREPRFVLVPLRFASEAWPRAGLGEPRSASNANKPASSWPLKQGRKKCSKHGCDLGTSTVYNIIVEVPGRLNLKYCSWCLSLDCVIVLSPLLTPQSGT